MQTNYIINEFFTERFIPYYFILMFCTAQSDIDFIYDTISRPNEVNSYSTLGGTSG